MKQFLIAFATFLSLSSVGCTQGAGAYRVYIGTYTRGSESQGIYRFDFDAETGKAGEPVLAAETENPSFLAVHKERNLLYATGEVVEYRGEKTGSVVAFSIDPATGDLTRLNARPSLGAGPCHLSIDPTGKHVLVANYSGGSVAALPITGNGSLAEPAGFVQHQGGSGVNERRQQAPYAHSINIGPDGRTAFVADLGADRVYLYDFDPETGKLSPAPTPFAATPPGGGPRHFTFHPSGKFAYTNNELTSAVTAFRWDANARKLEAFQTITTLPEPHDGNSTAEIVAHPSGKFLYVSNRGHNSIASYRIDTRTGALTPTGHTSTGGTIPRNFAVEPGGRWLIAANQDSGNVTIFRIDMESGRPVPTGQELSIAKPVCVRFLAM